MTTTTTKTKLAATVSHAKPKAAAKKPTKQDQAGAAVARMRQAALDIVQPSPVAEIVQIPVNFIKAATQVRTEFNDETIRELASDIAANGIIQPIIVRRAEHGYLIIAGERRVRAARLAELDMIPAIVTDLDNDAAAAVQIAENIQREDLSLADTAKAVRKLYELNGNSVTVTAEKVHKSKSWVSKHLAASCPELRHMAKEILEGGYSEDLEIILTIDKLQALDWCGCSELCKKVKKGDAGRKTVLDTYAAAKEAEEKRKSDWAAANDPEKAAAAKKQREEADRKWKEEQRAAEEQREKDPGYICNWVCSEAEYEPDERDGITEAQRQIMTAHLELLHSAGKAESYHEALVEIVRMINHGSYTPLEIAAYVRGMQGQQLDVDELVNLTVKTISDECA